MIYALYRGLTDAAGPFVPLLLARRTAAGREDRRGVIAALDRGRHGRQRADVGGRWRLLDLRHGELIDVARLGRQRERGVAGTRGQRGQHHGGHRRRSEQQGSTRGETRDDDEPPRDPPRPGMAHGECGLVDRQQLGSAGGPSLADGATPRAPDPAAWPNAEGRHSVRGRRSELRIGCG